MDLLLSVDVVSDKVNNRAFEEANKQITNVGQDATPDRYNNFACVKHHSEVGDVYLRNPPAINHLSVNRYSNMHADSTILKLSLEVSGCWYQEKTLSKISIDYSIDISTCEDDRILHRVKRKADRVITLEVKFECDILDISTVIVDAP